MCNFWIVLLIIQFILTKHIQIIQKHTEKTGAHPTFEEFVDYIIEEKNAGRKVDDHFSDYNWLCWPCSINYDIIAHTETLQADVQLVNSR